MIKNPETYKRGRKENIHSDARITIICDRCNKEWQTQYSNYKSKNTQYDYCQSCKNTLGICGMKNKKHSADTIKKLSIANMGENASFYGRKHTSEQKLKWSEERKGKIVKLTDAQIVNLSKAVKNYWSNLTPEEKANRLAKNDFASVRRKALTNGGLYSKLHCKIKNEMEKMEINDFESESYLGGYIFDEVNEEKKLAIEINGDYWHANPIKYKEDNIIHYPKGFFTAKQIWEKDKIKIDKIKNLGYKVYVIWESDFKNKNYLNILKEIQQCVK